MLTAIADWPWERSAASHPPAMPAHDGRPVKSLGLWWWRTTAGQGSRREVEPPHLPHETPALKPTLPSGSDGPPAAEPPDTCRSTRPSSCRSSIRLHQSRLALASAGACQECGGARSQAASRLTGFCAHGSQLVKRRATDGWFAARIGEVLPHHAPWQRAGAQPAPAMPLVEASMVRACDCHPARH